MEQKWNLILVILVFHQRMTSGVLGDITAQEGQQVEIKCEITEPYKGTMIVWFRVLDTSGMEFIASFSNTGILKSPSLPPAFSNSKIKEHILILRSFTKADSGIYNCASLKSNELKFGPVTRLDGEKVPVNPPPAAATIRTELNSCTTAAPCVCKAEIHPELFCTPIILGPLAGGCGLLLLLLIITTVYCNQKRTRRCPHHYKRKQRGMAPEKHMMTNRYV